MRNKLLTGGVNRQAPVGCEHRFPPASGYMIDIRSCWLH